LEHDLDILFPEDGAGILGTQAESGAEPSATREIARVGHRSGHGKVQVAVEENLQLGPVTDLREIVIEGKPDDRVVFLVELPRKCCVALIVRELDPSDTVAVGASLHVTGNAASR